MKGFYVTKSILRKITQKLKNLTTKVTTVKTLITI